MRGIFAACIFLQFGSSAFAQSAGVPLSDLQRQGRELFNQSCRVCHSLPSTSGAPYGPVISRDTQQGRDDLVAEFISNGTPHMPAFKHHFQPAQISAIVAYIRTIPTTQATAMPRPVPSQTERERQQREAD
jgi:mono/diheme cytochrome c family protein